MIEIYLDGELLKTIRYERRRSYVLFCDECLREIREDEPCTVFEFPDRSGWPGSGGSLCSCEKCLPSFMKDVKIR